VFEFSKVKQSCKYLTVTEKEIIQQLNLVRMYPKWYAYFYLKTPSTPNEISLKQTLLTMKPTTDRLKPDSILSASQKCHAISSGLQDFKGHERIDKKCKMLFDGECIHYGSSNAQEIVYDLLVDEGIESLGHRNIILTILFTKIGLSMQPHKSYRYNTVIGFGD
jgi:hypothetical protein